MKRTLLPAALLTMTACLAFVATNSAKDSPDAGFAPLFNGKDLTGWVNVNGHPSTFYVKDGEIITTGKPTGFLRTEKQYENFELEMDWMHENKIEMGNSGLFVWGDPLPAIGTPYTRGIEVQVLVNFEKDWATSHGDLFSIWGAHCTPDRPHPKGAERCLPSERLCKGGGEWNHYKVIANDGAIKLHVNGKEVSGVSKCNPRKGYLALESEGAVCHFKNIKIKELPSTNPKPEEICEVAKGHRMIFNGLDFAGWKAEKDAWTASNGHLVAKGKSPITSEKSFGPCELVFDWKQGKAGGSTVTAGGKTFKLEAPTNPAAIPVRSGAWNRQVIQVDGNGPITFTPGEGLDLMHVYVLEKGK